MARSTNPRVSTTLTVDAAAKLAWCPETIVFVERVRRETRIAVSAGAELLALSGSCSVARRTAK